MIFDAIDDRFIWIDKDNTHQIQYQTRVAGDAEECSLGLLRFDHGLLFPEFDVNDRFEGIFVAKLMMEALAKSKPGDPEETVRNRLVALAKQLDENYKYPHKRCRVNLRRIDPAWRAVHGANEGHPAE